MLQGIDPWIRERKQCHQCTEMIINVQCDGMLNLGFIRIFVLEIKLCFFLIKVTQMNGNGNLFPAEEFRYEINVYRIRKQSTGTKDSKHGEFNYKFLY